MTENRAATESTERREQILDFWFGPLEERNRVTPERSRLWFGGSEGVDRIVRERFAEDLERAGAQQYDAWAETPRGRLALILILDQFSRHIHRGRPEAFGQDGRALQLCLEGLQRQADRTLKPAERSFFYLPLEHAEDLVMQDRAVAEFAALIKEVPAERRQEFAGFYDYALRHREVIARFGRFPHRNRILGRPSTAEEKAFLKQPGSSF